MGNVSESANQREPAGPGDRSRARGAGPELRVATLASLPVANLPSPGTPATPQTPPYITRTHLSPSLPST